MLFTLPSIQRFSAVFPDATVQPLVLKIPVEFRTLYAASKLTPDDVLTFGYQIASGMVSTPTYVNPKCSSAAWSLRTGENIQSNPILPLYIGVLG